MQLNKTNGVERILTSLGSLNSLPKIIIKFGTQTFLALFALGSFLVAYNHISQNCNPHYEFIATSLVNSSFTIFAEAIIGALIIDFIFKKT